MSNFHFMTLRLMTLAMFAIPSLFAFQAKIPPSPSFRNTAISKSFPPSFPLYASQLLEFQEATTNVTVVLVGAMHYNPTSIKLAEDTITNLGKENKLGSVIVESCDIRWNKTADLYEGKPYLSKFLNNEMRTACDVAQSFDRPVLLGDQRINITSEALKSTLKDTLVDLVTPPKGWVRFGEEVSAAWRDTVPFGGKGSLGPFAFLDPMLLLVFPVSLIKYPLSFLVRSPVPTSIVLSLLFAISFADDPMTMQEMMDQDVPLSDYILSFVLSALEIIVFARLLLKPLLADRNKVLADVIREQCQLYAGKEEAVKSQSMFAQFFGPANSKPQSAQIKSNEVELVYAPGSRIPDESGESDRVVVAVLGMAHCNGIKKLLDEAVV